MTDDRSVPPVPPDEDPELGEPISLLWGLREAPGRDLLGSLRRSIARRTLIADLAEAALVGPGNVAINFINLALAPFLGRTAPPARPATPDDPEQET